VAKLDDFVTRTVRCVSWSPNGQLLAATSFDGDTAIWRCTATESAAPDSDVVGAVGFEMLASLQGHENEVKGAAWSSNGSLLATSGRDKNVWVWDADSGGEFECAGVLSGHGQDVKAVKWLGHPGASLKPSEGGATSLPMTEDLVSCSYDNTVRIWREDEDAGDWECAQVLEGHTSTVWDCAVAPDARRMVSVGQDARMLLWGFAASTSASASSASSEAAGTAAAWRLQGTTDTGHKGGVLAADWSPAGNVVVTCGADDALRFFHIEATGSAVCVYDEVGVHDGDVNCARWCPWTDEAGGRLLASCGDDGVVRIWRWNCLEHPAVGK
jgi:WD40 repeat protein